MFVKITSGNTKETRRIFLTNKPGLDIIHHFFALLVVSIGIHRANFR